MRKIYLGLLVLFLVLAVGFSPAVGWWVFKRVEKSLEVPVQGRFEPHYFQAAFTVRQAAFNWENKIGLEAGDIQVKYSLLSLFSSGGIKITLSGRALPVKFLGDLSRISPRERVKVDDFFAELVIDTQGLKEVAALRIKSPELQFQMGRQKDPIS